MQEFLQQFTRPQLKVEKHTKFFNITMDKSNIQETSKLSSRLEDEFSCLAGSTSHGFWYIGSEASTHMTGAREYFCSYKEEQMDFQITMGNKTKCTPVVRGTIDFQRESGASTNAANVFHAPILGMNLILVIPTIG